MARSANDATRFTSTTPYASSIPPSAANLQPSSRLQQQQKLRKSAPGPVGETPLEKVKRLRAAADRARDAQVTTFDKIILRGRVVADFAHRATTLFLIGATVVAGGVTVYALGDMMVYNRKKRAQFFEEQKAVHQNAVFKAKEAIIAGSASEQDIEFVEREVQHDAQVVETARAKAAKKGIFKRGKEWLFSGLKTDEDEFDGRVEGSKAEGLPHQVEQDDMQNKVMTALAEQKNEFAGKAKQAFANEKDRQRTGGPLDQLGTAPNSDAAEVPKSGGGWTSFMTGR